MDKVTEYVFSKRKGIKTGIFIAGIAAAVFFWALDAAVDIFRFKDVPFVREHSFVIEVSLHLVFLGLIIGLALYVRLYIVSLKMAEEKLKRLAITDSLTQTFNRTKLSEIMRAEIERAKRFDHPLSVIMFDIDRFKEINDRYGHLVGDEVLKTTAAIARKHIRKIDYLVRFGGDEFVVIIPETSMKKAGALAERILAGFENHSFDEVGRVSVSFGITELEEGDDMDALLKRADDTLYKAKSDGRNRVAISA